MQIIEEGKQTRRPVRRFFRMFVLALVLIVVFSLFIYWRVQTKYADRIISIEQISSGYDIALVFGAGLKARGTPGAVLEDRILTGIDAYQYGAVNQLLMSGDNSSANHNEVQAMQNLAVAEGFPKEAIILDHAGVSTVASCQRAGQEFELEKVVLVTQAYHLKRALYVCNELGVEAVGIDAARRPYQRSLVYKLREIAASVVDWFEVLL